MMLKVYTVDIQVARKVRYLGVVHYAGSSYPSSELSMGALARPSLYGVRCGVFFENAGETPIYLEHASEVAVTCIACTADRRRQ